MSTEQKKRLHRCCFAGHRPEGMAEGERQRDYEEDDGMTFLSYGERLAKIREDHHLTRKAMAQAVGVAPATWSNYERDVSFPHPKTVLNVKSVFHVNEVWLDEGETPIYEDGYVPGESPLGEKVDYKEHLLGIAHDYEYQHLLDVLGPEHEDIAYKLAYKDLTAKELLALLGGKATQ